MPIDESKFLHARIPEPYASDVRNLAGTRRPKSTANAEVILAIDEHLEKHRALLKRLGKMPKGKVRK